VTFDRSRVCCAKKEDRGGEEEEKGSKGKQEGSKGQLEE